MEHPRSFGDATDAALYMSASNYVRLLHPASAIGSPTIMAIPDAQTVWSRTCALEEAPVIAEASLDEDAYISLNRFFGPRGIDRLAALNALYLDLDYYKLPNWSADDWQFAPLLFTVELESRGLPQPSLLLHSGRGLAAIWLIEPLPRQALPRWQAAMRDLINLFRPMGADPACSDAARVFRLPGTLNRKSRREVQVIGGTLRRHAFDPLADLIHTACGNPTRAQLKERKARQERRLAGEQQSRGLTPARRFGAIARDLHRLRDAWGGVVPEGYRNTYLHVYGTCLTHTQDVADIEAELLGMAELATPGLRTSEVKSIVRSTLRRAEAATSAVPALDGRLHYSGATIAHLFDVSDELARALGIEQVITTGERRRRKAVKERERRAAQGAVARDEYLAAHSLSREQPWVAEGISRATWYRRRKALETAQPGSSTDAENSETGPCPLQGPCAMPQAKEEGRRPSSTVVNPPPPARARLSRETPETGPTQPRPPRRRDPCLPVSAMKPGFMMGDFGCGARSV
jgi:hypothetical protein